MTRLWYATRRVFDGWKVVAKAEEESVLLSMFVALPLFVVLAPVVFVIAFFLENIARGERS